MNPPVGDCFITSQRYPILTLVADTSPGVHDTCMAACDARRYELLGCTEPHSNCHDNLFVAMAEMGVKLSYSDLASFNIFMNIQVQPDGRTLKTMPVVTSPGDYIILRAEMDCYVAFSTCPQDIVSIQGHTHDAELRILTAGFPQIELRGPWVP